tara:strand:- start:273 stop:443 length:171 start_codon:yes stop_codon:yes gene_type:complete
MKITFAMPEILVLLSWLVYSDSAVLSVLFFMMGIFSRLAAYASETKSSETSSDASG